MRITIVAFVSVLLLAAASPDQVASAVADQGLYVEPGASVDVGAVSDAVADARAAGGRLGVVVLADEPPGGATTFADAVLDRIGAGTVFVVAPETVGWASDGDVYTNEQLDSATDAALDGRSDTEVVERFVATLIGAPVGAAQPTSSGGSGIGVLVLVVVGLVAVVAFVVWRGNKRTGEAAAARLEEAKRKVQEQLDAVANDIIDLDAEISLSGNEQAREFYERASATYTEVNAALGDASTPQRLIELSTRLDEAIWELDAADAVLDGQPIPPKPEPPEPEPVAVPTPPTGSPARPAPYRRPARRSSYTSPDLMNILIGAAGMMMGGRRRSRLPGTFSGGRMGRSRSATRTRSRSSSRMRGGGRRRR